MLIDAGANWLLVKNNKCFLDSMSGITASGLWAIKYHLKKEYPQKYQEYQDCKTLDDFNI